jgi:hypothetical protein
MVEFMVILAEFQPKVEPYSEITFWLKILSTIKLIINWNQKVRRIVHNFLKKNLFNFQNFISKSCLLYSGLFTTSLVPSIFFLFSNRFSMKINFHLIRMFRKMVQPSQKIQPFYDYFSFKVSTFFPTTRFFMKCI